MNPLVHGIFRRQHDVGSLCIVRANHLILLCSDRKNKRLPRPKNECTRASHGHEQNRDRNFLPHGWTVANLHSSRRQNPTALCYPFSPTQCVRREIFSFWKSSSFVRSIAPSTSRTSAPSRSV